MSCAQRVRQNLHAPRAGGEQRGRITSRVACLFLVFPLAIPALGHSVLGKLDSPAPARTFDGSARSFASVMDAGSVSDWSKSLDFAQPAATGGNWIEGWGEIGNHGEDRAGLVATPRLLAQLEESDSAAPMPDVGGETFVPVPDLADRLRKLDAAASVEWDGRRLRIQVLGQRFALFLATSDMVINGSPEKVRSPLGVYRGELYVPQDAVDRIADVLAKTPTASTAETTVPVVTSPTPSPMPSPTPSPTPVATPTPQLIATPSATPIATPTPVASPSPTPTPSPRPTVRLEVIPSPRPTSQTPSRTPLPTVTGSRPDVFARALRERAEAATYQWKLFRASDLQQLASVRQMHRILLDPDDGDESEPSPEVRRASALSLDLAMRLKARLELAGYEVVLTREDMRRVPVTKKVEIVTKAGAHVLLSVRVGTSATAEPQGVRVLYPSETVDYAFGRPAENGPDETVPPEQVYQAFQDQSRRLASLCLAAFKGLGVSDSAAMVAAPLYLHRRAPMPAVLVEVGYLSNPADRARLLDDRQKEELVQMLATTLQQFGTASNPTSTTLPRPANPSGERSSTR